MYEALEVGKIVQLVLQKLYIEFGVRALLVVDEFSEGTLDEKSVSEMAKAMKIPWLSVDILKLNTHTLDTHTCEMIEVLKAHGVVIHKIFNLETFEQSNQALAAYICLFLSDVNILESEKYAYFSFQNPKDQLIYQFLKMGKVVYYQSKDLTSCNKAKVKVIELQSRRIQELHALGLEMIGQKIHTLEGFCDIKRLKAFEGETIILAENVILSPLAKDFIKSGAVTVVRK
ncbi:hypothetical protein [Fusibacter ferrireducens]|uniref:Uncharacterized protein n=1 Tax=Fusibacter ferrireducens TaxID=2785058 RepID=A0ABR9ZZP4_9FIRM|nr:hypothetical protein [Fusibacter ferrireducens]MBF4695924.1 hypothetical protein [Fusibacter ferrireducens]